MPIVAVYANLGSSEDELRARRVLKKVTSRVAINAIRRIVRVGWYSFSLSVLSLSQYELIIQARNDEMMTMDDLWIVATILRIGRIVPQTDNDWTSVLDILKKRDEVMKDRDYLAM